MNTKMSIAAKKRLGHLSKEELSKHMAEKVKKGRWSKTTKKQRSEHAKKMLEARYNKTL